MNVLQRAREAYEYGGLPAVAQGGFRLALSTAGLNLPYYTWKNERLARKRARELHEAGVGRLISEVDLRAHKTSDTVFLLGSGSSINDITDEEWAYIDRHDTIGLNRWPIHPFVPTFHVFEVPHGPESSTWRRQYWKLLDERESAYSEIPVILKDVTRSHEFIERAQIPVWLEDDLILSYDTNFPGILNDVHEQRRLLGYLLDTGCFDATAEIKTLYRKRGSISYLLHLATVLGYETIVLCGVDMNDSKYFFEAEGYQDRIQANVSELVPSFDPDEVHTTADKRAHKTTLEDIIYLMNETVLRQKGISLFVQHGESKLHPRVPVYER